MSNTRKKSFQYRNLDGYTPSGDAQILSTPVTSVGLHEETVAKLQSANINTLGELASIEMKHAYRIDKMNRKDVFAALRVLHSNKLDFKRNPNAVDGEKSNESGEADVAQSERKPIEKNVDRKLPNTQSPVQNRNDDRRNGNDRRPNAQSERRNIQPNANNGSVDTRPPRENRDNKDGRYSRDNNSKPRDRVDTRQTEGQPQRERINTHDFLRGKLNEPNTRTRRDGDRNNDRNIRNDKFNDRNDRINSFRDKKPAKRIVELPPLVNPDGLYKVFKQGKWGYRDTEGKMIIEPQFDEAYNFSEGLAAVELGELLGFINTSGEVVIDYQFESVCSFSEGLASVTKDEKCAYINKDGEYEFDFEFQAATSFVSDVSLVKKDGKWGFLNRQTKEIRLR